MIDATLLSILACPEDKGPLYYLESETGLYNPRLRRLYPIVDDIPVLLVDEATTVDDDEHQRIWRRIESEGIQPTFSA